MRIIAGPRCVPVQSIILDGRNRYDDTVNKSFDTAAPLRETGSAADAMFGCVYLLFLFSFSPLGFSLSLSLKSLAESDYAARSVTSLCVRAFVFAIDDRLIKIDPMSRGLRNVCRRGQTRANESATEISHRNKIDRLRRPPLPAPPPPHRSRGTGTFNGITA